MQSLKIGGNRNSERWVYFKYILKMEPIKQIGWGGGGKCSN